MTRDEAIRVLRNTAWLGSEKQAERVEAAIDAVDKRGEWTHRDVDENTTIKEWQAAKCSVCGRWLTTPYMYYFDHFNYCPNCGARMGAERDEAGNTNRDQAHKGA